MLLQVTLIKSLTLHSRLGESFVISTPSGMNKCLFISLGKVPQHLEVKMSPHIPGNQEQLKCGPAGTELCEPVHLPRGMSSQVP